MSLLQKLIDFLMSLFGGAKPSGLPSAAAPAPAPFHGASHSDSSDSSDSSDDSPGYRVLVQRQGAALIEDDDDGERRWLKQINTDVPRAHWRDEFGPLSGPSEDSLATFLSHRYQFERAQQDDAMQAEATLQQAGYRDAGHYFMVEATLLKHFGEPHGDNVGDAHFSSAQMTSAAHRGAAMAHQANMNQQLQASPELLAPIEGVTMEQFAQLSAQVTGLGEAQFAQLLAQQGLDMPRWLRASEGWNDRMSRDHSHTLTTIYGRAFQAQGAGAFGGASQAFGAASAQGVSAGGQAPVPMERACEITGAVQAWDARGQDINALLQQQFGLTAQDYATVNGWWQSQAFSNPQVGERYHQLVAHFRSQYEQR